MSASSKQTPVSDIALRHAIPKHFSEAKDVFRTGLCTLVSSKNVQFVPMARIEVNKTLKRERYMRTLPHRTSFLVHLLVLCGLFELVLPDLSGDVLKSQIGAHLRLRPLHQRPLPV